MTLDYWDMEDETDEELFTLVGYFIARFSGVELALTALLATVSGVSDLEVFHTLILGSDSKSKTRKLRALTAESSQITKGGNLDTRLEHFYDNSIDLRNRIAHGWLGCGLIKPHPQSHGGEFCESQIG